MARHTRTMAELRYRGRRSGRRIALPVAYARVGDLAVVRVARAETKNWWRNFTTPHPVSIRLRGRWADGTAHVAYPGSLEHEELAAYYQQTFPRCAVPVDDPLVVVELPHHRSRSPRAQGWFPRRWMTWVTAGEALGFAGPALAGVLTRDAAPVVAVTALLAAGLGEGAVLGAAQAHALAPVLPGLRARTWTAVTALGGAVAWAIALTAVTAGDAVARWPLAVSVPLALVGATALLSSIGIAQWVVLRRFVARAHRWIVGTALGWLSGLAAFFALTTPLWQPGQPFGLVVGIGLVGGVVMAAVMAAVTGRFLIVLLATPVVSAGVAQRE
ncbi:hypothetical protein [Nocardia neocaledoniensis]|uniref:hypothetical protein n=1 Tax=Nocardia neocaledoniensis TaxID=236511 RepID=UPI00245394CB|nr:hypothetical protein [Nocardia neocaledoniensis]